MELVRNVLLHKPFVQITVYFIKEVICSAIEDDVDRTRSEKVRQIDDSVAFPVIRIFIDPAETIGNVLVIRKRTDVDTSRHGPHITEHSLMSDGQIKSTMTTHGITRNSSCGSVSLSFKVLINI